MPPNVEVESVERFPSVPESPALMRAKAVTGSDVSQEILDITVARWGTVPTYELAGLLYLEHMDQEAHDQVHHTAAQTLIHLTTAIAHAYDETAKPAYRERRKCRARIRGFASTIGFFLRDALPADAFATDVSPDDTLLPAVDLLASWIPDHLGSMDPVSYGRAGPLAPWSSQRFDMLYAQHPETVRGLMNHGLFPTGDMVFVVEAQKKRVETGLPDLLSMLNVPYDPKDPYASWKQAADKVEPTRFAEVLQTFRDYAYRCTEEIPDDPGRRDLYTRFLHLLVRDTSNTSAPWMEWIFFPGYTDLIRAIVDETSAEHQLFLALRSTGASSEIYEEAFGYLAGLHGDPGARDFFLTIARESPIETLLLVRHGIHRVRPWKASDFIDLLCGYEAQRGDDLCSMDGFFTYFWSLLLQEKKDELQTVEKGRLLFDEGDDRWEFWVLGRGSEDRSLVMIPKNGQVYREFLAHARRVPTNVIYDKKSLLTVGRILYREDRKHTLRKAPPDQVTIHEHQQTLINFGITADGGRALGIAPTRLLEVFFRFYPKSRIRMVSSSIFGPKAYGKSSLCALYDDAAIAMGMTLVGVLTPQYETQFQWEKSAV